MKRRVERRTEADLLETHPLRGKASGWFFRVWEASPAHWKVEGVDAWGRSVTLEGADADDLLARAELEAQRISESLDRT